MSGRVISDGGEALPGAAVVAVHTPSGTQYGTITNSEGRFTLQGMRPGGPYTVDISFVGYSTGKYSEITLLLGESFILNATLRESTVDVGEVLVVGAAPSAFGTDKTGAATNISNE
ncbi:MAG TPA: carboxypeptidase-like regulatory domain-containing protein, partial [Prolixibacteraceae bacterium]|nr:carboxypeptidase-like regulatory domain-containing protein [Prolixibacteraceae bacterium]